MLSTSEIQAIRSSWVNVAAKRDAAAAAFYARLFEQAPQYRALFRTDPALQRRKLMETLATVVDSLDSPEALKPVVAALGRRHAGYGIRPEHYETVGAALIWTLEKELGPAFDADTRRAWTKAYSALSHIMKSAKPELKAH